MLEIARYTPTNANGVRWIYSVYWDVADVELWHIAIITDYGNINTRRYPQRYYGYFFYTTDSSVVGSKAYLQKYVGDGSYTGKTSVKWKSITSSQGNAYYYFTFRPRELAESDDYNNIQYAGASFTNTCEDGDIIDNGEVTTSSDRDDYALTGIDYLEETYGPGRGGGGGGGGYGKSLNRTFQYDGYMGGYGTIDGATTSIDEPQQTCLYAIKDVNSTPTYMYGIAAYPANYSPTNVTFHTEKDAYSNDYVANGSKLWSSDGDIIAYRGNHSAYKPFEGFDLVIDEYGGDAELYAKLYEFFTTAPEPKHGKGVITLEIATAGEELIFESSLLEKSITQFIDNDATINFIGAETEWEILWQFNYGGDNGQILINSDFEAINDFLTNSITGELLRSEYVQSANNIYAQKDIVAREGRADRLSAFTNVAANQTFTAFSGYDRLIVAKANASVGMPFEVGFHWQVGQSMQMCLIKRDGTFIPHGYYVTGEYITVSLYGFTTNAFNGTLKYYYATDPGSSVHPAEWVELDASVAQNVQITVNMFIVFAIPN